MSTVIENPELKKSPYKFNAEKRREFIRLLADGGRRGKSAEALGFHRTTIPYHIKRDPRFAKDVDEAEMSANEYVEDALRRAALKGNVVACQVWLYNRSPGRWADRRVSVSQRIIELESKNGDAARIQETSITGSVNAILDARAALQALRSELHDGDAELQEQPREVESTVIESEEE